MSFGFGVGDVLTVSKLAWDVYNAYKDAPGNFQNISHELKSLHIIIAREKDGLGNKTLDAEDQEELKQILQGCESVLRDLDNLLDEHKRLLAAGGGSVSRFVVRVKLSFKDVSELRARLISNTVLFNTFIARCAMDEIKDLIANGSHAPGLHALGLHASGLQPPDAHASNLRRAGSTSTLASFAASLNSKAVWKKLCRNLHNAGVTAEVIRQRGTQVLAYSQNETTPVHVEGTGIIDSQSASPSQASRLEENDGELSVSKEDAKGKSGSTTLGSSGVQPAGPIQVDTPSLIAAAEAGDADAVTVQLKVLQDPDSRYHGGTGLHSAASDGFENGANIEASTIGNTGGTALDSAANAGHVDVERLLLGKGANIEATRSDTGATALYNAAHGGHANVVKLLLEKGANIEATRSDDDGGTALYYAAHGGHADVVKLLLEKGANIEATRSLDGGRALYSAAYRGHADVVKLLLEKGANTDARSRSGHTALDIAAYLGHAGAVKLLLEKGTNIEAMRSDTGATALYNAAHGGHADVVKLLLEKGVNIEATRSDDEGGTALYYAAHGGHADAVKLLLEKGADIEATRSLDGGTALFSAAFAGHADAVKLLLEKGANTDARSRSGHTALDIAAYLGHADAVKLLWK